MAQKDRASAPVVRRTFDQAERLVGGTLESVTATRRFTDVVVLGFRAQKAISRALESQSRAALHLLNLPTRGDVSALNRRLTVITAELREIAARLDEDRDPGP
jgi:hypothetical protein